MNLLGIVDTETTGLLDDPKARPIEVAIVRWSIDAGCVVDSWTTLIRADSNPCEDVNGIPVSALALGVEAETCLYEVNRRLLSVDAILAHNAPFDREMLARIGGASEKPWIDTKADVEWSRGRPGCSLVELAAAHHVPVVTAHRALADCVLLAGVLESTWDSAGGLDGPIRVRTLMIRAMRPKVTVEALVPYADRDKAKTARFSWDGKSKRWTRTMAREDVEGLPFQTRVVTP